MPLLPIDRSHAHDLLSEHLAYPQSTAGLIGELCRGEVSARGASARHHLLRWLSQRLSAVVELDEAALGSVLDRLLSLGDLLEAPGGRIAPAPARWIALGSGHFLVLGAVASSEWQRRVSDAVFDTRSELRRAIVSRDDLESIVGTVGGRVLGVDAWSGLDRTPAADGAWLEHLDRCALAPHPSPPVQLEWRELRTYRPDLQSEARRRWLSPVEDDEAMALIRAAQPGGWHAYAWGKVQRSPGSWLVLSRDEARRTELALDRQHGVPSRCDVASRSDDVELTLTTYLPRAEYRHLEASAVATHTAGVERRFSIPHALWPSLSEILTGRLGLDLSHHDASRETDATKA